jgi:hypothetical protein
MRDIRCGEIICPQTLTLAPWTGTPLFLSFARTTTVRSYAVPVAWAEISALP